MTASSLTTYPLLWYFRHVFQDGVVAVTTDAIAPLMGRR